MPAFRFAIPVAALLVCPVIAMSQAQPESHAPWVIQDSGTMASLRGIDSADGTVAWASGTGGTVLRTTDGGAHWQKCTTPDAERDGAALDFRGVQAWDAQSAIGMASGPGEKSRLSQTNHGCNSWKLLFYQSGQRRLLGWIAIRRCVRKRQRSNWAPDWRPRGWPFRRFRKLGLRQDLGQRHAA